MEENNNPNQKEQQNINNNPQQEQFQYQPQGGQQPNNVGQQPNNVGQQPNMGQQPNNVGQQPNMGQKPNMGQAPEKKSKAGLIIAIVIGVLILLMIPVIVIVVGVFGFIGNAKKEVNKQLSNYDYNSYDYNYSYNTKTNTSTNSAISNTTTNTLTNSSVSNTISNTTTSTTTKGRASTYSSPLKINEWGLASKYVSKYVSEVYADKSYIDVPVRVTKVTRGDEADKIVRDWCDKQSLYKYEAPKANTEWVVFDYEIDLSNVTFDAGTIGTDAKVSSAVKGLDGGSVKYNDITYILSTKDISESEYKKQPGVYKGKFVVTLPIGCKDYLVKLGDSYNGAESYFRIEE